jgi:rod shape determining protein RodA
LVKRFLKVAAGYFRKLDKQLFLVVCAVSLFSVVLMFSIYRNGLADRGARLYQVQLIAFCGGAVIALVMSAMDYNKFVKLWFLYAPLSLGVTLLTFSSLGDSGYEISDNRAWIDLGFITLQPSEILKAAFIMTFAYHISKVGEAINKPLNIAGLAAHGALPLLIVVAQRDDGTAIIFGVIFAAMLFAAGLSWKYILPCVLAAPPAAWLLWEYVMKDYQKARFIVLFMDDPMSDPNYAWIFYQQHWGKIALGSGQLFGKGLFADEYVRVPEAHNDFILSYVGQCFGFIGCVGLIAALTYICMKIIADSRLAKDDLGKYMCVGVYAMIFAHCVLNIGMVLTVLPVIGIPLPFVSQGGTSMLSLFICVGLVMSVYSHSEKKYNIFYDAR